MAVTTTTLHLPQAKLPTKKLHYSHPHLFLFSFSSHSPNWPKPSFSISCKNNNFDDSSLASEFAFQVEKINAKMLLREEAMEKSRELLFVEMCKFMNMKGDEFENKWKSMEEDEKWRFVEGFVSEWGKGFKPLSVRSVKDMVEEHLEEEESENSTGSVLFSGFKKFWGF